MQRRSRVCVPANAGGSWGDRWTPGAAGAVPAMTSRHRRRVALFLPCVLAATPATLRSRPPRSMNISRIGRQFRGSQQRYPEP